MNKKLILGIIAGAVALALIVVGIILVAKKHFFDLEFGGSSSGIPSTSDSSDESSSSGSNTDNNSSAAGTIDGGNVGIGKVEGAAKDTVEVPITIKKNPGFYAGQYYFNYDSSALEYVGYDKGDIFGEYEDNNTDGTVVFVINNDELKDTSKNGTIVTLKFKIKSDAKSGDYKITLGKDTMLCNLDEQVVNADIADGKVTVK